MQGRYTAQNSAHASFHNETSRARLSGHLSPALATITIADGFFCFREISKKTFGE